MISKNTRRLIIRKPLKTDWREIHSLIDKNVTKNFFTPYPYLEKHSKNLIDYAIKEWSKNSYEFIIQEKDTKEIIGMAGVKKIDKFNKSSYLFFWVGSKYRNKGYALESISEILDFWFNGLKMRKLISEVATFNIPSNKLHKKLGMKLEGVKRKEYLNPFSKEYADMNLYGIFKDEWLKVNLKLKEVINKK